MSRVFISYRRADTAAYAGRLADDLMQRFGADNVFMDIDTIAPGADYVDAIQKAVGSCRVLLALIGVEWLTAADEHGRRRLDDPTDLVRLEIAEALARGVVVIPVLVANARMPGPKDLPEALAPLATRNAHELTDRHWRDDVRRLGDAIEPPGARWWARRMLPAAIALVLLVSSVTYLVRARRAGLAWEADRRPDTPVAAQTAARREDAIHRFTVVNETPRTLTLEIEYTYVGDYGGNNIAIIASAVDGDGNRRADGVSSVSLGIGDGIVRVTIKALLPRLPFSTTALEICLHVFTERDGTRSYDTIRCRTFPHAKSWSE